MSDARLAKERSDPWWDGIFNRPDRFNTVIHAGDYRLWWRCKHCGHENLPNQPRCYICQEAKP